MLNTRAVLLIAVTTAPATHAVLYPWPVLTYVGDRYMAAGIYWYPIETTSITIDDPTVPDDITAGAYYTHKTGLAPTSQLKVSTWGENTNNTITQGLAGCAYASSLPLIEYMTLATACVTQATKIGAGQTGGEGMLTFRCVTTAMLPYTISTTTQRYRAESWRPDPEVCIAPGQTHEWCALNTKEVTFNYDALQMTAALGAVRTANVSVECTADMKYTLTLTNLSSSVPLSNGMNATLTANDAELGATLTGQAGDANVVKLTTTLTGTPDTSGAFIGTEVLSVSYP